MNGIMHQIRIHHKGSSLYAEEIPGGKDRGATWVINTEHYLVIGTGIRAMALTCEQSIGQFAVELEKWQISGAIEWKTNARNKSAV